MKRLLIIDIFFIITGGIFLVFADSFPKSNMASNIGVTLLMVSFFGRAIFMLFLKGKGKKSDN